MRYCVIMQGAPGSGKSTIARVIAGVLDAVIHSTDDLRMRDGVYVFDPNESGAMHRRNHQNAVRSMSAGVNVIIDNTNVKAWEAKPYVEAALRYGYVVRFVRCTGEFPNHHGVPQDRVEWMREAMDKLTVERCLSV